MLGSRTGKTMKKTSVLTILGVILCALVFWVGGCSSYEQPGETAAEGRRRHQRNLALNRREMMQDIDALWLADEPSKLTDTRTP